MTLTFRIDIFEWKKRNCIYKHYTDYVELSEYYYTKKRVAYSIQLFIKRHDLFEACQNQAKNCCATEGTIADNQGCISSATNNQYNNNIIKMAIATPTKTFLCFIIVFV